MSDQTIFDLGSHEEKAPIEVGDAIIIIKPDGEVRTMTCGVEQNLVDNLKGKAPTDMTDEELALFVQGQKLFLLSMASQSEVIMSFLADIANQPGTIDEANLAQIKRPN